MKGRGGLQAFYDTEWTQTELGTKHWEISVEKFHRPADLRKDKGQDLEDD